LVFNSKRCGRSLRTFVQAHLIPAYYDLTRIANRIVIRVQLLRSRGRIGNRVQHGNLPFFCEFESHHDRDQSPVLHVHPKPVIDYLKYLTNREFFKVIRNRTRSYS
jgi:hypothetical protein